jgi:hypothetical protein
MPGNFAGKARMCMKSVLEKNFSPFDSLLVLLLMKIKALQKNDIGLWDVLQNQKERQFRYHIKKSANDLKIFVVFIKNK